mmetsp:Transcript_54405/g.102185  ORF Transcript_54405/g.102185 Transcript_54405/m.102185 type:complete len:134 (-) Transcript_54405:69-470(-)
MLAECKLLQLHLLHFTGETCGHKLWASRACPWSRAANHRFLQWDQEEPSYHGGGVLRLPPSKYALWHLVPDVALLCWPMPETVPGCLLLPVVEQQQEETSLLLSALLRLTSAGVHACFNSVYLATTGPWVSLR